MAAMDDAAKEKTWEAIAEALKPLESDQGFQSPSEVIVVAGTR